MAMIVIKRTSLPEACIQECSTPDQDPVEAILYWQKHLEFAVNKADALAGLRHYGLDRVLADLDEYQVSRAVLHLACCYFRAGDDGTDFSMLA
jgi:hypothetical protein